MFHMRRAGARNSIGDCALCQDAPRLHASLLRRHLSVVLALSVLALAPAASASEPVWNAFAGREDLQVRGVSGVAAGADVWFSVTKEQRKIGSGTVRTDADASLSLPVRIPEMKPGVALALELTLRAGSDQGRVLRSGPLWAFAKQPFEPHHNPAAPRPMLLYDPEGKTEPALRGIELPFDTVTRLDLLADRTNAVIVVGEGVSLERERGLWQALSDAVARGNHVLLLAPKDGRLHPPPAWGTLMAGDVQKVLRHGNVAGLPYKLDLTDWPPDGRAAVAHFRLAGFRDEAVFDVMNGEEIAPRGGDPTHAGSAAQGGSATPWREGAGSRLLTSELGSTAVGWDDAASGGRFRACGLGIVAHWNDTPAARWLLAEMLGEGE